MANKIVKIDIDFITGSGVSSTVSWKRMEGILRAAGELRSNERISGYKLTDDGLQYYVKRLNES